MVLFEKETVLPALEKLTCRKRTAFALLCCSRIFPQFLRFCEEASRFDVAQAATALIDRLWKDLWGEEMNDLELENARELCRTWFPQEEDSQRVGWAYAEDGAAALAFALGSRISCDPKEAAWASRRVFSSLDEFVITHEPPGLPLGLEGQERLRRDPLVAAEEGRQKRDLQELLERPDSGFTQAYLRTLRERAELESGEVFDKAPEGSGTYL